MEAMTGEHSEEYLEAMGIEIQALQWANHMGYCAKKPNTQCHQCSTPDMGIQAQALPRWLPKEVQGLIVCPRRQANQRN